MPVSRRSLLAFPFLTLLWSKTRRAFAQATTAAPAANTDWLHYANDLANTRYSPLDQIDADNFNELELAWRFKPDAFGPLPEYNLESTPLVVKGVLYSTVGARRDVVALDAATGELLWTYRTDEGERAAKAPRRLSGRGLSYWTDGTEERLLYVTIGYRLIALDAKTGQPIPTFGDGGMVDLKLNDDQEMDPVNSDIGLHATPCVAKDVVIVGAAHAVSVVPKHRRNVKGYVRGFDVRTGKRLWIFHTIPMKGEFGYDTWLDGTDNVGNAGVWSQVSADEDLNLAFLGVELPTGDENGEARRGPALFGESLVAVDLHTGERRWHFQMIHHGLWDYDVPCAAILCDIPVKGKLVKALAQPTKQGFLYVLNRETGKPLWPTPERPVPKGDVPGEWYSPTQPIPTKPPAYGAQGVREDDLIDFTPELRAEAVRLAKNYRLGPVYTPPSIVDPNGTWGTLMATGAASNWPGGSYDPQSHTVFLYSGAGASIASVVHNDDPNLSEFSYISPLAARHAVGSDKTGMRDGFRPGQVTVQGLPMLKPPYGRITAIDLTRGKIAWQIAHGETPDAIRNHPALKGVTIPRTGREGILGTLTTKTLVICGEAGFFTNSAGVRGAMLRAYDKGTGEEKGAVHLSAPQTGCPMTYMLAGTQYLVLAIGGGSYTSEFVAFRLPKA
jgi:quinoprotein glucose dehydrogenase